MSSAFLAFLQVVLFQTECFSFSKNSCHNVGVQALKPDSVAHVEGSETRAETVLLEKRLRRKFYRLQLEEKSIPFQSLRGLSRSQLPHVQTIARLWSPVNENCVRTQMKRCRDLLSRR